MRAETSALEFERVPLNPEAAARIKREALKAKVPQNSGTESPARGEHDFPLWKGLALFLAILLSPIWLAAIVAAITAIMNAFRL